MKMALIIAGGALIGVITTAAGFGWIADGGGVSGKGAFVNVVAVIFWVLLVNWIDDGMKRKGGNK
jgi:hypothetical protein